MCSCRILFKENAMYLLSSQSIKTGGVCLFLFLVFSGTVFAGGLRFSPQRVMMEGRQRSARLTLTNASKKSASYRISFVDILYKDDGSVGEAKSVPAGFPTARHLLRFSPSQVRLAAGETQVVRILVKGRNIPEGEYRVHAKLSKIPDVSEVTDPANSEAKKTVSVSVSVSQAISLPIILRRGKVSSTGKIQSITLEPKKKTTVLNIKLAREGNRSLYTDLVLRDPKGEKVTEVKGIAVPVPNKWRRYLFTLKDVTPAQLKAEKYTLELLNRDKAGELLDSQVITLK
jgi:P pilus assembly chaperone PapD